ncbi:MAG: GatB/YqeY domain-containing protein [Dehalococcoidia bacterium]|nr:GatB/YqeY domain-containing protein [Dehalococcoidia bacterium]
MGEDLQQRLRDDLKKAMKSGNKTGVSVLRLLIAGIRNTEINKGKSLGDSDVLGVIAREVKQRRESIAAYASGNRQDLVDAEEKEKAILLGYLPPQMSRDEIVAAAKVVISEVGALCPQDKGRVMGKLVSQLKGQADGREINGVVDELLQNS